MEIQMAISDNSIFLTGTLYRNLLRKKNCHRVIPNRPEQMDKNTPSIPNKDIKSGRLTVKINAPDALVMGIGQNLPWAMIMLFIEETQKYGATKAIEKGINRGASP